MNKETHAHLGQITQLTTQPVPRDDETEFSAVYRVLYQWSAMVVEPGSFVSSVIFSDKAVSSEEDYVELLDKISEKANLGGSKWVLLSLNRLN